jgi:hypothetical protein
MRWSLKWECGAELEFAHGILGKNFEEIGMFTYGWQGTDFTSVVTFAVGWTVTKETTALNLGILEQLRGEGQSELFQSSQNIIE